MPVLRHSLIAWFRLFQKSSNWAFVRDISPIPFLQLAKTSDGIRFGFSIYKYILNECERYGSSWRSIKRRFFYFCRRSSEKISDISDPRFDWLKLLTQLNLEQFCKYVFGTSLLILRDCHCLQSLEKSNYIGIIH